MQGLKELEAFSKQIEPKIHHHRETLMQSLQILDQECTNKHSGNEDKYVDCMKKLGKRVEKHSKKLEFALLFWKHKTYKCFEDPEIVNQNNYQSCKNQYSQLLDDILKKYQL